MQVDGEKYKTLSVYNNMITVPDCVVSGSNKIGDGHGEAKLYIGSKAEMHDFFGNEKFNVKCIMLKSDLIAYMNAVKNEYLNPSQEYARKADLPELWKKRMTKVNNLPNVIEFILEDQYQIGGPRGYIKSFDDGYKLIRELALPLISYIYSEKISNGKETLFYWKLFVDFERINEVQNGALVFKYGKKNTNTAEEIVNNQEIHTQTVAVREARVGQGKYREQLLDQCHYCPFTMISDERLLIASHIKPWFAANDEEKIDPYNGYMLSPMYDKLFDRGYITFTENKHVILSEFISPRTWKQIGLKNNEYFQTLPMDENRIKYLKFHHESVFKGNYEQI